MRRGRVLIAFGVAAAAAIAAGFFAVGSQERDEVDFLPDLDLAAPGELSGRDGGTPAAPRFYLGFESAAGNVGGGPLTIEGSRENRQTGEMEVVQLISQRGGTTRSRRTDSTLTYVRSADHAHWHLRGFMRYELRRADGTLIRPDRKTGFCLGDRYRIALPLERTPQEPAFPEECGKNEPGLLTVREGISVGYGDDYDPHVEGQEFDVTDLEAGRYLLVHRVNDDRVLEESDYEDNVSSMAFRLTWPGGRKTSPRVTVLARCPDSATCP
jgi:Lysyl oxidase